MTLAAGTPLGPYEVVAPIGAGGMGEVYRARDPRLGRDVAVKVLPASMSSDPERLRRFEQEARAAGVLNHPNITAVLDVGQHDGAPYVVQELLEGETLRATLAGGKLAPRKAVELARQMLHGLAAAHEKGIVHRDLKPENLFVTSDGRLKILDFGLARVARQEPTDGSSLATEAHGTDAGTVMGTVGYMSPEQVKGKPADARSDLFAFGAILYEMLSGTRAFHRDSAAETMSAILREEPPDLSATNRSVAPGLDRVIRHCLEKNPAERSHSAHDVAFDLEALSTLSTPGSATAGRGRRRIFAPIAVGLAIAFAFALGWGLRARRSSATIPSMRPLTFRRGSVWSARFGGDEKSIVYAAAWEGRPMEVFVGRSDGPDARPFGATDAEVLAVSANGEVALSLHPRYVASFLHAGTLARAAATGAGAPREVLEGVEFADFAPDGKELAIVRAVSGRRRLEYPIGTVLYESAGWIGEPRFSPRGDRIAFVDHPDLSDDGGRIAIVDLAGKMTPLTPQYASAQGLAWSPDGSEIWYTATQVGGNRTLCAVTPAGRGRDLYRGTGALQLHDVSRDGRVLMKNDLLRLGLLVQVAGESAERDLSWYDWSLATELSADGRTVLFSESGEGGGTGYSVFVRPTDGSPAVRLGDGQALALSGDAKRVLAVRRVMSDDAQLVIYPTGAGETKAFAFPGVRPRRATWLPDDRHFLMVGFAGDKGRAYLVDAESGASRPVTPEGLAIAVAIPIDAKRFYTRETDRKARIFSIDGGDPVAVPAMGPTDALLSPSSREGWAYVRRGLTVPAHVVLLELATGREESWKELMPADASGIIALPGVRIAPDGKSWAYSYGRMLSSLYTLEGLR